MTAAPIAVLHVDDEPEIGELTATMLEREDERFRVETATTAEAGLELVTTDRFDCVVSDYDMPGQNGIEFLEAVRAECADIPFILFTGKGSEEIASEAISAGVTDYLQKGVGTDQYTVLANRITNAVDRYDAERERRQWKQAVETAAEGIAILDADGRYVQMNDAYADAYGTTPEELLGRTTADLYPDDVAQWFKDIVRPELRRTGDWEGEAVATRIDGTRFEQQLSLALLDDGGHVCVMNDVTDRNEREATRKQAERRYRAIFEDPNILAGVLDADGTVLEVNRTALEYVDVPAEDVVGEPVWETPWWEDEMRPYLRAKVEQAADGNYVEFDAEHTAPTGETRSVSGVIRPVTDGSQVVSLVISARDVTERKAREGELRRERAFVDQAVDALDDLFYVIAPDGSLRRWNDRLSEVTGYTDEEIADMNAVDFFVEDDRDGVAAAIEEAVTDGRAVIESSLLTADGDRVPYELTGARLTATDGQDHDVVGIGRDIARRKNSEQALERLHETARALLHADTKAEIAEQTVDAGRDILGLPLCSIHLVDNRGTRLVPAAYTDALTDAVGDPPPDIHPGEGLAWEVFETGDPQWYDDVSTVPGRLNENPSVRSEMLLPLGDHGVFTASSPEAGAFDDVTVSHAEILTTHAETALDRLVYERDLKRQNDRLDQFASVVSHDLRNPLRVADGRLDLLRKECDSDHLDPLDDALDRMDRIVEDVLQLARHGKDISEPEPVDLAPTIRSAWAIAADTHGDAALVIDAAESDGLGRLTADGDRLRQLLENLLRNAVDHGGTAVTVTAGRLEDGFYIADDGPGIPEDEREAVFEAGHSTTDRGTGFGLSIVKQIVDAHGWEIRITDSGAGGTRFEITGVEFEE